MQTGTSLEPRETQRIRKILIAKQENKSEQDQIDMNHND